MKKLIKMYNEKYGNTLGVIDDDFNKEQMYRIYYFIKNNCDDKDIQERLAKIKLDKPKTLEQQLTKLEGESDKSANLPYTVSSKVLTTISANNVTTYDNIAVKNININKNRRYYIEFLGSKKLCSLLVSEEQGNCIMCSIGSYAIQAFNNSTDIMLIIIKINEDDITDTFTDLVIYEEEVKCLDNKYLETDLVLQNSISLGRIGDIGACSSAVGGGTEASGNFSHAIGNSTKALGESSHAEGMNTIALGDYSHAEGYYTKASSENQHVQGHYNIEDKINKYAHIVGNGDEDTKSNAYTLDWKGNGWYAGKLSQEGTPTENKDLVTKKYVDNKVKTDINDIANQLKSIKVFETFPNDTILESLPVDSTFEVKGFYSTGDMQKCLYRKTTQYTANSIAKANSTYYIKPITSNENIVFLPYYGIRAGKQYSSQNSTILSNITLKHGTTLKLPVGDYYFENPMDLKTKQLSLIGECMSFTPDSNTNGITKLIFNNLQEGQSAITIGTGSLFNVCILGNSEHYDYTIDRSKTYTDKNNIEKEVSTIKNYGIKGGAITTINNVVVQNFYYGAYLDTSNIYINNFFARKCHIGLSIGGDTKCKGVYGWDIHTLLQIRNSISSAIQVRADSCHHLVHLIGYSGSIYLADLDGDYCLGSLLKIGNAGEWGSIGSLTVNGMHGRACCLNVYNTETDTAPTSSNVTEAEVSNYGFISIEKNNRLDGAIITLNAIINDNPLDGASNYLTPQILIASAGVCYAMFNTTFLSTYGTDGSIRITKQNLLNSVALLGDSANNTRISINTNSAIYYINKTNPTDINVYKQTVETLE